MSEGNQAQIKMLDTCIDTGRVLLSVDQILNNAPSKNISPHCAPVCYITGTFQNKLGLS